MQLNTVLLKNMDDTQMSIISAKVSRGQNQGIHFNLGVKYLIPQPVLPRYCTPPGTVPPPPGRCYLIGQVVAKAGQRSPLPPPLHLHCRLFAPPLPVPTPHLPTLIPNSSPSPRLPCLLPSFCIHPPPSSSPSTLPYSNPSVTPHSSRSFIHSFRVGINVNFLCFEKIKLHK